MGAWTLAKRKAFITWSEVFHLELETFLDTNKALQVNKGLGKGRKRVRRRRRRNRGGKMCGHCLMVVDRCVHAHTCTAQVTHGEDGCSDSEIRTEELLLTQVQYLLRHMSL